MTCAPLSQAVKPTSAKSGLCALLHGAHQSKTFTGFTFCDFNMHLLHVTEQRSPSEKMFTSNAMLGMSQPYGPKNELNLGI